MRTINDRHMRVAVPAQKAANDAGGVVMIDAGRVFDGGVPSSAVAKDARAARTEPLLVVVELIELLKRQAVHLLKVVLARTHSLPIFGLTKSGGFIACPCSFWVLDTLRPAVAINTEALGVISASGAPLSSARLLRGAALEVLFIAGPTKTFGVVGNVGTARRSTGRLFWVCLAVSLVARLTEAFREGFGIGRALTVSGFAVVQLVPP